jgi:ectoine hydroxylase
MTMHMNDDDLNAYRRDGYLIVPDVFSPAEIAILKSQMPVVLSEEGPARVLEKDGRTVRSVHGSHATNETFRRLAAHPRLVHPAEDVLGSRVYVHQFKINVKAAFSGDIWKWHQDFIFWHKQDGMREPRCVNVFVFIDDVTEFNGPLFVVPGSHRQGIIDVADGGSPDWRSSFSADLKYALPRETLESAVAGAGIASLKGRSGSVLLTDPNILHSSPPNLSPLDRTLAIITYNSVENALLPVPEPRPEFLVSRTFDAIDPLDDDALLPAGVGSAHAAP